MGWWKDLCQSKREEVTKRGGWGHINEKDFAASQFCLTLFSVTRMVIETWYYFCQNCRVLYKMMWEGKITFRIENILILF